MKMGPGKLEEFAKRCTEAWNSNEAARVAAFFANEVSA